MNKNILRDLSYGVYIVTSKTDNKLSGCVANSVVQITNNKIAISINKNNYTNSIIKESNKFCISIMSKNIDTKLIGLFGYNSSCYVDKFHDTNYEIINDTPVIKNSIGYITCRVVNKMEVDTHTVFLGEIIACDKFSDEEVMTYSYYYKELKGKTPVNAPTYIEEKNESVSDENTFVCSVCKYRHTTNLDELPDDFKCPICGKGKEFFKKLEK